VKNPADMTDAELNAAVAVEVMDAPAMHPHRCIMPHEGWIVCFGKQYDANHETIIERVVVFRNGSYRPWSPSTSIADAWEVVEKMRERGWWWSAYGNAATTTVKDVCFTFQRDEDTDAQTKFKVYATTLPRAICLSALTAARKEKV